MRLPARSLILFVLLILVVLLAAASVLVGRWPELSRTKFEDLPYRVRINTFQLEAVAVAIDLHVREKGRLPTIDARDGLLGNAQLFASLFEANILFEPHSLDTRKNPTLLIDTWGHPLRVLSKPNSIRFWSIGKNAVDEGGAGDDIEAESYLGVHSDFSYRSQV